MDNFFYEKVLFFKKIRDTKSKITTLLLQSELLYALFEKKYPMIKKSFPGGIIETRVL